MQVKSGSKEKGNRGEKEREKTSEQITIRYDFLDNAQ